MSQQMESKDNCCNSSAVVRQSAINLDNMADEMVVVTHIENPEKFFCRLSSEENNFKQMNELIWSRVGSPFAERPAIASLESDDHCLAFSTIHKIWCRSRVDEVLNKTNDKDINGQKQSVKLKLLDYGSVEVISYDNIRVTTDEIIGYNSGQSFCFECKICLIKPFSDSQEWSSYANYLFKKQTKDNIITLKFEEYVDGVVVCDLSVQWPNDLNKSMVSMADFLVQTRVARYKMGHDFYHRLLPNAGPDYDHSNPNPQDFEWNSDEELNTVDFNDENKLFFV